MNLFSPRYLVTAVVMAAALTSAITARAVVIVNDTWLDGTRTDPAAPAYSENGVDLDLDGNLESVWYRGGIGTFDPAAAGGPLRLDLSGGPSTSQSTITTYFTPEATPVTLGVGETIKVTWTFAATGISSNSSQAMRVAIVNSPGANRLTSDLSPVSDTYTGYASFINLTSGNLQAAAPFELRERVSPGSSGSLQSSASVWTAIGNGATAGNAGFTSGLTYTYTFEATHTPANELAIVTRLTGPGLDGDGVAEVNLTDPTPNGGSFTFDTFSVRFGSPATTANIIDTSLFRVEVVPEPASYVMLGLGGILAIGLARRRKAG